MSTKFDDLTFYFDFGTALIKFHQQKAQSLKMSNRNNAAEVLRLKERVTDLENQVADYKRRLDTLRKAKNTTLIKREREVLEVGAPTLGQRSDLKDKEARVTAEEVEALKKKHAAELQDSKNKQVVKCDHEEEIRRLKSTIAELESDKAILVIENDEIKDQYESTLHQMSIREAEWCEQEEQFKLKLKQSTFGEKYAEWMAKTEAKIQELETTNALLKEALKAQRPNGPDPSQRRS